MRKLVVSISALVAIAGSGVGYLVTSSAPAQAIPTPQQSCVAFTLVSTTSTATPVAIPGMAVTINNGAVGRNDLVQLSSDFDVRNATVRLSYGVDGASPPPAAEGLFGPADIAVPHTPAHFLVGTAIAVIPLGPGTHRIQAFWRLMLVPGASSGVATAGSRCMTVEARTS